MKRLAIISGAVAGIVAAIATSGVIALASRNSGGTYSLPAGNPVVSGTTISSSWANTTLSDIQTELTNSLDRNGRGAMLAPLQLANGTVSLPSLTFGSDTDTGIYRIGANDMGLAAGGVLGLEVTASTVNATGTSAGIGLTGTGGATAAAGLKGIGTANGDGVWGVGAGNGPGGFFTGGATADGVDGTGGATSGVGGSFSGGAAGGIGVKATGTGSSVALEVSTGNAKWTASNPASTVAFTNTVTPSNIVKAWGSITTGASPVVDRGFNIASIACATKVVTVTFAQAMNNANYAVALTTSGTGKFIHYGNRATGTLDINMYATDGTTQQDLCVGSINITFMVLGTQ